MLNIIGGFLALGGLIVMIMLMFRRFREKNWPLLTLSILYFCLGVINFIKLEWFHGSVDVFISVMWFFLWKITIKRVGLRHEINGYTERIAEHQLNIDRIMRDIIEYNNRRVKRKKIEPDKSVKKFDFKNKLHNE